MATTATDPSSPVFQAGAIAAPDQPGDDLLANYFNALYVDLCRIARREVHRNGADGLLSARTVVHEAWLNLQCMHSLNFASSGHFLAYAARTMRGLVIDALRQRHARKRGGDLTIATLDTWCSEQIAEGPWSTPVPIADVAAAIDELAAVDPELAAVVDLNFFCGFTLAEVARMQGISERTVQRRWEKARLLLYKALVPR